MANNKNLKSYKPGQSGNLSGRPKDPAELKAIKQMTKAEFQLLIHRLIDLRPEDLATFKGTVLEMAMASAMQSAIKSGDFSRIQGFIERLFGKVKDEINADLNLQVRVFDYRSKDK